MFCCYSLRFDVRIGCYEVYVEDFLPISAKCDLTKEGVNLELRNPLGEDDTFTNLFYLTSHL